MRLADNGPPLTLMVLCKVCSMVDITRHFTWLILEVRKHEFRLRGVDRKAA